MSRYQHKYLEDIRSMRERVKKETSSQEFGSDEEIFVSEFQFGGYHEEEADWWSVAKVLSKEQLCEMTLAVIHVLIAGRVNTREGNDLQVIMRFYTAIGTWALGDLKSPDEILGPLDAMKHLVFASARAEARGWWADTVRLFSLVHMGVLCCMGLRWRDVDCEYNDVIEDLCASK